MKMVCVFRGSDPTEAFLVQHWLERNDIVAEVRGTDLLGCRGHFPVAECWPSVWVPAPQQDRAEAALQVYEGPTLVHPDWVCSGCGEENAATFGSCWKCSRDRPDLPAEL